MFDEFKEDYKKRSEAAKEKQARKNELKEKKSVSKKELKQQKEEEKINKFLSDHGLEDLSNYSKPQVKKIMADLAGNKWFKASMAFSFAKAEEQAKTTYLSALVEQNWLIIKQNDEIIKSLKE